jgi:hypothetical protein
MSSGSLSKATDHPLNNREAVQLLKQAEEKANYKGWFGSNKMDEAVDLYGRAANSFKIAKQCICLSLSLSSLFSLSLSLSLFSRLSLPIISLSIYSLSSLSLSLSLSPPSPSLSLYSLFISLFSLSLTLSLSLSLSLSLFPPSSSPLSFSLFTLFTYNLTFIVSKHSLCTLLLPIRHTH